MKKAIVLLLVITLSIGAVGAVNAGVWEDYFNTPFLDGSVFGNVTETNVTEEKEEIEKDWLKRDERIFPRNWSDITPKEEWTDKPSDYFNVTPREKWTNFPPGYFDITPREQWTNFPPGWFD